MSLIKFGQDVNSVDYWINYCTFGIDKDYREQPYYSEAQRFWSIKKCDLIETFNFRNKPNVVEFINNITVLQFYEKDDCYTMIGVIKMHYKTPPTYEPEYNYKHFCFIYDPIMLIQKQITLTDYDGFVYDIGMFMKYDYMLDTEDQEAIDKELYDNFTKIMGYKEVEFEDFSTIFNQPFKKGCAKTTGKM
uniref:Uncharacterized protein n=1 Tax=viral metagenome TaxID=1070528 RepID=A0A6C0HFL1_9ZZZZ